MKMTKKRYAGVFCFFLAPALLLYTIYFFIPLLMAVFYSFTNFDGFYTMDFIGISNYLKILKDKEFYTAVTKTLFYTLVNMPFKVILPLLVALLLVSKKLAGKTFFRSAMYLPVLLSSLIIGITVNWMFGQEYGLVNFLLIKIGAQPLEWAMNPELSISVISIASNWASIGFFMVIFIGALNNVPLELYESANMDGATGAQRFYYITLPLIKPTSFLVLLLTTNDLLKEYAIIQGISRGGPGTSTTFLIQYIYEQGFDNGKNGYASAISVLAMLLFFAIAMVQFKYTKGGEVE